MAVRRFEMSLAIRSEAIDSSKWDCSGSALLSQDQILSFPLGARFGGCGALLVCLVGT
jgi:hypothetical protein